MLNEIMVTEIGIITLVIFLSVVVWAWIDARKSNKMMNDKEI